MSIERLIHGEREVDLPGVKTAVVAVVVGEVGESMKSFDNVTTCTPSNFTLTNLSFISSGEGGKKTV